MSGSTARLASPTAARRASKRPCGTREPATGGAVACMYQPYSRWIPAGRTAGRMRRGHTIHRLPLVAVTTQLALLPGWLDPSNLINAMGSWAVLGIMLIIFA